VAKSSAGRVEDVPMARGRAETVCACAIILGVIMTGARSVRILCESRLRWWNGANSLRETASRRLEDAKPGCDDDDASSSLRLSFGVTPMEDVPLPEDEAGMGGELW